MNKMVHKLEGFAVYLDDVVVYCDTWEEHLWESAGNICQVVLGTVDCVCLSLQKLP